MIQSIQQRITIKVSKETHEKLKNLCREKNKSIDQILSHLIQMDSGSCLAGVRGFESLSPHKFTSKILYTLPFYMEVVNELSEDKSKTETIKERAIYVYLPSHGFWDKITSP